MFTLLERFQSIRSYGKLVLVFVAINVFSNASYNAVAQYSNQVITYSGQSAPGTDGAVFDDFYAFEALGVSESGIILFSANLKSDVGDTEYGTNEWGVWKFENDSVKLIARKGGPVPGLPGKFFLNDRNPKVFMDYVYEKGKRKPDVSYV